MSNPTLPETSVSGQVQAPHDFTDSRMVYVPETGKWTYTSDEGISYEYDETQHAWFPMWNENLVNSQQSIYDDPSQKNTEDTDSKAPPVKAKPEKRPLPNKKPVTSVYVSGLPLDTDVDEISKFFTKCGILQEDINTGKPRIKLYTKDDGSLKGDALVTYFKEESVALACTLLDDTEFRLNESSKIHVHKAEFKEKTAEEKAAKKPRVDKKVLQKKFNKLERKLDWFDADEGKKAEKFNKVVILKHMFTQQEIEDDPALLLDLKEDIRSECEKLGEVTNIVVYDKTEDGVCSVKYREKLSADACVKMMNGRFFAGRQIKAEIFDGKTKYQKSSLKESDETEEEAKQRLEKYAEWLESSEN
ncbi:hypothetical protein K493DRAFT_262613 [Basidiobolus meristosporus CBS 931.73]|uniref:RRM domain-containing protein n=1 Tax=Basidiobolus meristosporus CBS 931.73 TaxID=1314790 RepID=A0A1Y1Y5U1_9FUNG|nr:hypothetical protein K493DRAFT_262613 [Basidiobolus meristosporus CBS 931.73]|eukprot:ORX93255.1 hypothetical protein K493DRAFT_262613 [Basidiobolus meristosporus CBS 931.73]